MTPSGHSHCHCTHPCSSQWSTKQHCTPPIPSLLSPSLPSPSTRRVFWSTQHWTVTVSSILAIWTSTSSLKLLRTNCSNRALFPTRLDPRIRTWKRSPVHTMSCATGLDCRTNQQTDSVVSLELIFSLLSHAVVQARRLYSSGMHVCLFTYTAWNAFIPA